jgi:serine/threonine protein kinase
VCQDCCRLLDDEAVDGLCSGCAASKLLFGDDADLEYSEEGEGDPVTLAPTPVPPSEHFELPEMAALALSTPGAGTLEGANFELPPAEIQALFAEYRFIGVAGKGGMGTVWKAEQVRPLRMVALKMISRYVLPHEPAAQRFQFEANATAKLNHPNILRVIEVGHRAGHWFYTMPFVEGATDLGKHPRVQARDQRWIAGKMATIAAALHHAHSRGILHRDLKPGNILIGTDDEPQIADFGLATSLDRDSQGLTRDGDIVGTPYYMAPEQAKGEQNKSITVGADVYSLGAMLYELLCGQVPFRGENPLATLALAAANEAVSVRKLNRQIDPELDAICLKCLEKEARDRYPTAQALADDLTAWLEGRPIIARPPTTLGRIIKWAKRRPGLAATLALSLALATTAGIFGYEVWQSELSRKQTADEMYDTQLATAFTLAKAGDMEGAEKKVAHLGAGLNLPPSFERQALKALIKGSGYTELSSLPGVNVLTSSDEGKHLVAAGPGWIDLIAPGSGERQRLWPTGASEGGPPVGTDFRHVVVSDSQGWLIAATATEAWRWSIGGTSLVPGRAPASSLPVPLPLPGPIIDLQMRPTSPEIAVITAEGGAIRLRGDTGATLASVPGKWFSSTFSPNGLLWGLAGTSPRFLNLGNGEEIDSAPLPGEDSTRGAAPQGFRFLDRPGFYSALIDSSEGRKLGVFTIRKGGSVLLTTVAVNTRSIGVLDQQTVVAEGSNIRVFNSHLDNAILRGGHRSAITHLASAPDGSWAISVEESGRCLSWDKSAEWKCSVSSSSGDIRRLYFPKADQGWLWLGPHGAEWLETAQADSHRWINKDWKSLLAGHSPDGGALVIHTDSGGWEAAWCPVPTEGKKRGSTLDVAQSIALRDLTEAPVDAWSVLSRPQVLIQTSQQVRWWDTVNGHPLCETFAAEVDAVALAENGRRWAIATEKGLFIGTGPDFKSLKPLVEPQTPRWGALAWSLDGRWLAAGSLSGGEIWLWDIEAPERPARPLLSHTDPVRSIAFSPDGMTLASAEAGKAHLWRLATRRPVYTHNKAQNSGPEGIQAVAFAPDSSALYIATGKIVTSVTAEPLRAK